MLSVSKGFSSNVLLCAVLLQFCFQIVELLLQVGILLDYLFLACRNSWPPYNLCFVYLNPMNKYEITSRIILNQKKIY
jgi:hypothetical protein